MSNKEFCEPNFNESACLKCCEIDPINCHNKNSGYTGSERKLTRQEHEALCNALRSSAALISKGVTQMQKSEEEILKWLGDNEYDIDNDLCPNCRKK